MQERVGVVVDEHRGSTIECRGKGNYTGTAKGTFAIAKMSIAKASIAKIANKAYSGKAIKPVPKVTASVGGKAKVLSAKTDYTVKYAKNKAVGKATVTVVGKGNYTGKVSRTFNIVKAKNPLVVKGVAKQVKLARSPHESSRARLSSRSPRRPRCCRARRICAPPPSRTSRAPHPRRSARSTPA